MNHIWPITGIPSWLTKGKKKFNEISRIDSKNIKLLRINNVYFMYSIVTGIFFELDNPTYQIFTEMKNRNTNLRRTIDSFQGIFSNYLLEEIYEEIKCLYDANVFENFYNERRPGKGLTTLNLNISNDCNLACKYCFFYSNPPPENEPAMMEFETAKLAIDYLLQNSSDSAKRLNIVFFGGEPLLNFQLIEKCLDYLKSIEIPKDKEVLCDIFTNGTLLTNPIIEFVAQNKIRLIISIDGPKEINDKLRPFKHKSGSSFDTIIRNVNKILTLNGKNILIRTTLTKDNISMINIVQNLSNKGFKNFVFDIAFSVENNFFDNDEEFKLFIEELNNLASNFKRFIQQGIKVNVLSEPIARILKPDSLPPNLLYSTCPAGRNFIVVTPGGDIYPCHYFVNLPQWKMGSLYHSIRLRSMIDENQIIDLNIRRVCPDCWLRGHLCGGPCPFKILQNRSTENIENLDVTGTVYCKKEEAKYIVSLSVLKELYPHMNYPFVRQWERFLKDVSSNQ